VTGRRTGLSLSRRLPGLLTLAGLALASPARAQIVEDGSDSGLGKADARTVLDLVAERFKALDPKVSALRRVAGGRICGSVNVKNREGLYLGERGFVADPATRFFGRVPDGPELLNPRAAGFAELEQVRQAYFDHCLD
jgi:hypothetical protein